jgi:hypothetical protein
VAERTLGRPLTDDEIVHHVDGDRLNNAESNLVVMSLEEHTRMHNIEAPQPRCEGTGRFVSRQ